MQHKHLFVTLSRSGWGETSLGVQVARQLVACGDTVSFLAHSKSIPAIGDIACEIAEVSDDTMALIQILFQSYLANGDFTSIVLSDFLTTNYTCQRFGVNPEQILEYGLPVITLDTWEYDITGSAIDVLNAENWEIGTWIERIPHRLVPVPIGRPTTVGAYCSLPTPLKIARHTRRHIRKNVGVNDTNKAVLFCTAEWQHGGKNSDGERISTLVPQLLWTYLKQIEGIRLIHVGPTALPIDPSDERYLWMPPVSPNDFDRLLGSVDLVLSANISATTIGRAIALGVPVIVATNSYSAKTISDIETSAPNSLTPTVRDWLENALPLYPFSMWPLGFWHFLKPLLSNNPYSSAIKVVELVNELGFVTACRELLFDIPTRDGMQQNQARYVDSVRQLPTAAELIGNYLR